MLDGGRAWVEVCRKQGAVPVGVERLYENALDWQRLPHVHRHTIGSIVCLESGATGWRVKASTLGGTALHLDLSLDRASHGWVVRVGREPAGGLVARVGVRPRSRDETGVSVSLFVAQQPTLDAVGPDVWSAGLDRFWDADVAMMAERQRQIDQRIDGAGPNRQRDLGSRDFLTLPLVFELGGREFVLAETAGRLVAYPRRCPHQLGPLDGALHGRVLTCPWHGYRFDVMTGENLTGGACRLGGVPDVQCSGGRVIVSATH